MPRKPKHPGDLGENKFKADLDITLIKGYVHDEFVRLPDKSTEQKYFHFEQADNGTLFLSPEIRKAISKMKRPAQAVLLNIPHLIKKGEPFVRLNQEQIMDECDIASRTTYNNGIDELVENDLIAPTDIKHIYWVNPNYFFHGERKDHFKEQARTVYTMQIGKPKKVHSVQLIGQNVPKQ